MKNKTLVTICIPVCYELEFLKGSIRQIMKHRHEEIDYEIIICDQTNDEMSQKINDLYKDNPEIKIVKIPRVDAGYPIDIAVRMASGEYFCTLDADAFPISNLWLYLPVKLIEKFNFSFIGKESGLHHSYTQQLGEYLHLNNYYRISRTDVAKKISEEIGFIRPQNKSRVNLTYEKNVHISCDNGVLAQWYSDTEKMGPKLCLMMDKIIGKTPELGVYGMVIDDLVFHMVFGQTNEECGINNLGNGYASLNREINENGLTDEMIEKLLSLAKTENILNLYGEENLRINGRQYYNNDAHYFLDEENEITKFMNKIKKDYENK
jgi:hypothetical protein